MLSSAADVVGRWFWRGKGGGEEEGPEGWFDVCMYTPTFIGNHYLPTNLPSYIHVHEHMQHLHGYVYTYETRPESSPRGARHLQQQSSPEWLFLITHSRGASAVPRPIVH